MKDPNTKLEVVTEIGTFGSLNISDPTTLSVDKQVEDGLVAAVEEETDMTELAKKILNS